MYPSETINCERRAEADLLSSWKFSVWGLLGLLFNTKSQSFDKQKIEMLRFEISSKKLNTLFLNRQICAADIRCLDANSKQCLKKICLKTCLRNTSLT